MNVLVNSSFGLFKLAFLCIISKSNQPSPYPTFIWFCNLLHLDVRHNMEEKKDGSLLLLPFHHNFTA